MTVTIVTTGEELQQIVQLSQKNIRTNISEEEKNEQGFILPGIILLNYWSK